MKTKQAYTTSFYEGRSQKKLINWLIKKANWSHARYCSDEEEYSHLLRDRNMFNFAAYEINRLEKKVAELEGQLK